MAKSGLHFHAFAHQLKGFAAKEGWVLCVGAGASLPLFPSWNELVKRLIQCEDPHRSSSANALLQGQLTKIFQPDALIEAARDRLGLTPEKFSERLGEEQYMPACAPHRLGKPVKASLAIGREVVTGNEDDALHMAFPSATNAASTRSAAKRIGSAMCASAWRATFGSRRFIRSICERGC